MRCSKCGHELAERFGRILTVDTSCPKCGQSSLPGLQEVFIEEDGENAPAKAALRVHVYRLSRIEKGDSWYVTKHGPSGEKRLGSLWWSPEHGLCFRPFAATAGLIPASLTAAALPAFLSHAAYDKSRGRIPDTPTGNAMEVEITLMGSKGDNLEYIASEIPEVPGLFGMLGCGWPPRELDPQEHQPCD